MYEWTIIPAFFFIWGIIKVASEDGFFVPLPMGTVKKMLEMAEIEEDDVLYDLGSGDGRIVIEAADKYGIKAKGIEVGSLAHLVAKTRLRFSEVDGRVELLNRDFFDEDINEATVVTIYLTPKLNRKLKPKLEKELNKGSRVISAAHEIEGWDPVKKVKTGHFWTYMYRV